MPAELLTELEIEDLLADHPGWSRDGTRLVRTFKFDSFVNAFSFMTRVALTAEKLFHHPEWSNVYGTVEIAVTDHDAGGLSTNDKRFVELVDAIS